MTDTENTAVEQLWYTWSDVGLSTVHAGFRIRAASPGLSEIYSERVKSMDRYMRYVLPPGTDRFAITPDKAPVCLAYLRTDQNEYVLVRKVYVGEDGVGRLGNFFVHLLALGNDPDIDTTISLWKSKKIWKNSDAELDRRSARLEQIQLDTLEKEAQKFKASYAQVGRFLPFLIEAYLTRKDLLTPIYLAAAAHSTDMIVNLIYGLITCLPFPLIADLTFSTYEPDVTKAAALIVGTSWIEVQGKPMSSQVFLPQLYQAQLALNCSSGEQSSLDNHPLTIQNPLAKRFARYATDCLLSGNTEKLYELRTQGEGDSNLTINSFLSIFNDMIISAGQLSPSQTIYYLKNVNHRIDKLSTYDFRQNVITHALNDSGWWLSQLYPLLADLLEQGKKEKPSTSSQRLGVKQPNKPTTPYNKGRRRTATQEVKKMTLIETLTYLAQDAVSHMIVTSAGYYPHSATPQSREAIKTLIQMMNCCTLPEKARDRWRSILTDLRANTSASQFLIGDWQQRLLLLSMGGAVLTDQSLDTEAIRPFLIVEWCHLGEFLVLSLAQHHWEWIVIVIRKLAEDTSLTSEEAQALKQRYSQEMDILLQRLLREQHLWFVTATFMTRLSERGYTGNAYRQLQARLLDQLINATDSQPSFWLSARGMVIAVAKAGHINQASYSSGVQRLVVALLSNYQEKEAIELCRVLVSYDYRGKADLLPALLQSSTQYRKLETALALIYPTPPELATFFLQHGAQYLPMHFQALLDIYSRIGSQPEKMQCLFILLNANLTEEEKRTVLHKADLKNPQEYTMFLYNYGQTYLQNYQQFPHLADEIIILCSTLAKRGYEEKQKLFLYLFEGAVAYIHQETLLDLAGLVSVKDYAEFFKTYGMQKRYVPFFRQSSLVLNWFSLLVQYEQRQSGDFFPQKMEIVLFWLDPAVATAQSITQQTLEEVTKIIPAAALTPPEERRFLKQLGKTYLPHLQLLPFLKNYVRNYALAFTVDDLEREEAKELLIYLNKMSPFLALDQESAERLQSWQIIHDHLTLPDPYVEKLAALAKAVYVLNLQDNYTFTIRLAQSFVRCINTVNNIKNIIHMFSRIMSSEQLLYTIAEQSARKNYDSIGALGIYIVFILEFPQGKNIWPEHIVQVFLDILLQHIQVKAIPLWRNLDSYVCSQQLSDYALDRWRIYLFHLNLSDKILARKGRVDRATTIHRQDTSWWKKLITGALRLIGRATIMTQMPEEEDIAQKSSGQLSIPNQEHTPQQEQENRTHNEPDSGLAMTRVIQPRFTIGRQKRPNQMKYSGMPPGVEPNRPQPQQKKPGQ